MTSAEGCDLLSGNLGSWAPPCYDVHSSYRPIRYRMIVECDGMMDDHDVLALEISRSTGLRLREEDGSSAEA